jgi:hypothetical protein
MHLGLTKIVAAKCFFTAWQADLLCTGSLGINAESFFCLNILAARQFFWNLISDL